MNALALREDRFLDVLRRLIALTPKLQNNPTAGLVPEERLAAQVVLEVLALHIQSGFIQAESLAAPGNVQITGFGEMAYYHAPNEQARLEDFRQGFAILRELLVRL